jgi:hypothetical protein
MLTEFHVTIQQPIGSLISWNDLCLGIGVKPLVIRLARGTKMTEQIMCSTRVPLRGDQIETYCQLLTSQVEQSMGGRKIARIKAEVDMQENIKAVYYEMHAKINDEDLSIAEIANHASRWDLGLSFGVLNGNRWLTYREKGKRSATSRFYDIEQGLSDLTHDFEVHKEAVLLDTNQELDKNWVTLV